MTATVGGVFPISHFNKHSVDWPTLIQSLSRFFPRLDKLQRKIGLQHNRADEVAGRIVESSYGAGVPDLFHFFW